MEDRHAISHDVVGEHHESAQTDVKTGGLSSAARSWRPITSRFSLFALFDGHGGAYAAEFAAKRVPALLAARLLTAGATPETALDATFNKCDDEFITLHKTRYRTGTTALAVLLDEAASALHVANAGDTRAVLCRGDAALRLTTDHKPSLEEERMRIRQAGGVVGFDAGEATRMNSPPHRVFTARGVGGLSVTRSLGDAYLKNVPGKEPVADESLVLGTPEVKTFSLTLPCDAAPVRAASPSDSSSSSSASSSSSTSSKRATAEKKADEDRFVIIATDGVWDVLDDDEACNIVKTSLFASSRAEAVPTVKARTPCQIAADALVSAAYNAGSQDNISAILVLFGSERPDISMQQS